MQKIWKTSHGSLGITWHDEDGLYEIFPLIRVQYSKHSPIWLQLIGMSDNPDQNMKSAVHS
jgi:hypothetical protein